MILADTSVWIEHLRRGNAALVQLLNSRQVLTHPFVIGELALGNLRQRSVVLSALQDLPKVHVATDAEALHFVDRHSLFGLGIGYIDVHLLAATQLTPASALWTFDKRLSATALRLGVAASVV